MDESKRLRFVRRRRWGMGFDGLICRIREFNASLTWLRIAYLSCVHGSSPVMETPTSSTLTTLSSFSLYQTLIQCTSFLQGRHLGDLGVRVVELLCICLSLSIAWTYNVQYLRLLKMHDESRIENRITQPTMSDLSCRYSVLLWNRRPILLPILTSRRLRCT